MADFERRLRATAAAFAREPASQQDSASAGAIEALAMLQRELDSSSNCAEDKCVQASVVLLEPEQEALLRAVGWDLLHTLLPFAAAAASADAARRLLLRAGRQRTYLHAYMPTYPPNSIPTCPQTTYLHVHTMPTYLQHAYLHAHLPT